MRREGRCGLPLAVCVAVCVAVWCVFCNCVMSQTTPLVTADTPLSNKRSFTALWQAYHGLLFDLVHSIRVSACRLTRIPV